MFKLSNNNKRSDVSDVKRLIEYKRKHAIHLRQSTQRKRREAFIYKNKCKQATKHAKKLENVRKNYLLRIVGNQNYIKECNQEILDLDNYIDALKVRIENQLSTIRHRRQESLEMEEKAKILIFTANSKCIKGQMFCQLGFFQYKSCLLEAYDKMMEASRCLNYKNHLSRLLEEGEKNIWTFCNRLLITGKQRFDVKQMIERDLTNVNNLSCCLLSLKREVQNCKTSASNFKAEEVKFLSQAEKQFNLAQTLELDVIKLEEQIKNKDA